MLAEAVGLAMVAVTAVALGEESREVVSAKAPLVGSRAMAVEMAAWVAAVRLVTAVETAVEAQKVVWGERMAKEVRMGG